MYQIDSKRYDHVIWTADKGYSQLLMDEKAGKKMEVLEKASWSRLEDGQILGC